MGYYCRRTGPKALKRNRRERELLKNAQRILTGFQNRNKNGDTPAAAAVERAEWSCEGRGKGGAHALEKKRKCI